MVNDSLTERVAEYVLTRKDNELQGLTAASIAEALAEDEARIVGEFEKNQKVTLNEFLLREKLHRAYFILRKDANITTEELAERLAFASTQSFIEEFEKYFAISPDNYRQIRVQAKL